MKKRKKERTVVLFPAFDNLSSLADQYHRLRWYIPDGSGFNVYLFYKPSLKVSHQSIRKMIPLYFFENLGNDSHIYLLPWNWSRFLSILITSKVIMFWKVKRPSLFNKISLLSGKRIVSSDPSLRISFRRNSAFLFDHMEGTERQVLRDKSKARFAHVRQEISMYQKAFVFGNGPSLSQAKEFNYFDGVRIACNSVVRNQELLDYIKPHFIIATDFVFHLGPSRYAAEFRRDLVSALKNTGAYFVTIEQLAPLFFYHFPDMKKRTIAVPLYKPYDPRAIIRGVNVQLANNFIVHSLNSVLTMLMLPIASTVAEDIFLLGCDGRKPDDEKFWSHHAESQYTGLLKTVYDTHPGFFEISYVDYYNKYCDQVETILTKGESLGKTYASLVPSYVPALEKRIYLPKAQIVHKEVKN